MLTVTEVRNAKPRTKDYKMTDSHGLFLHVAHSGKKTFRYRYELPPGRESVIVLGEDPAMTLAEARRARDEARALVKRGVNPSAHRKAQREAAIEAARAEEAAKVNTFRAVCLEWMERQEERWKPRHQAAMRRAMENNAFPVLGNKPIHTLTPADVVTLLHGIEDRGAPAMAARVLMGIRGACRYAVQCGKATYNPAADMRGVLKGKKTEHHKAMPLDAMPEFLLALRKGKGIESITRAAIMLTVLCATRTGETVFAKWSEIDRDKALWNIPAERMKNGKPHVVPLSRQALDILKEMELLRRPECSFIFPAMKRTKDTPQDASMSDGTMREALRKGLGYKGKATIHGFRSLFDDVANESVKGFDKDAIERALSHQERNQVRAAYHRAIYLEERRVMLQWWADWLEAMEQTGTVPPAKNYLPQDFHQGTQLSELP